MSELTERCPHCGLNHEPALGICPATGLAMRREARPPRRAVIPTMAAVQARPPTPKKKERRALDERVIDGRYRVIGLIGEGGMGAVYESIDLKSGEEVAVKVLHPEHVAKKEAESRLRHEARVVGALGHPSICAIYDVGRLDDGSPYLVMERLRGSSLAAWIERQGALDAGSLIDVMSQVLSALSIAHERGVIHRDLKPDNIFLVSSATTRVHAKLLDFGISKASGIDDTAVDLTRTGMVMGTPYYMAPEQARGDRNLDHRVDLWAVGVILYEALTGRRPFVARNYNALLVQILTAKPRPIEELNPNVSPALGALVSRALSKLPEDRQQTARELEQALVAARPAPPPVMRLRDDEPVESKTLARPRRKTERIERVSRSEPPRAELAREAKLEETVTPPLSEAPPTLPATGRRRAEREPDSVPPKGSAKGSSGSGLPRPREVPRPASTRRTPVPTRTRTRGAGGAPPSRRRSSIPPPGEESSLGDSISEDPTVVLSRKSLDFLDFTQVDDSPPVEDEDTERTVVDPPSFVADTPTERPDRRK